MSRKEGVEPRGRRQVCKHGSVVSDCLFCAAESRSDFQEQVYDGELIKDAIADLPPGVREAQERAVNEAKEAGHRAVQGNEPTVGKASWMIQGMRDSPAYRRWERNKSDPDAPQRSDAPRSDTGSRQKGSSSRMSGSIQEVYATLMAIHETLKGEVPTKIVAGHEAIGGEMGKLQAIDPVGSTLGNEVMGILLHAQRKMDEALSITLIAAEKTAQWAEHIVR